MGWVLFVLGGIILLPTLLNSEVISEFIGMIVLCWIIGGLGGLISWLLKFGWEIGFDIGVTIGAVFYAIDCISRIIKPEIIIEIREDGTKRYHSNRGKGITGLLVLICLVLGTIL